MAVHNPPDMDRGEGWRGPREAEAQVMRYRWQRDWAAQAWQRLSLRNYGRIARGALLLVAFLVLLVIVCYDLLFPPLKTPLLTIAAPAYPWPLPVNSWSAEDVADLSDLDKQSLQYSDCSDAWASKQRGLRVLEQQLEQIVKQGSPNKVIIIYLSAHGVVDGEGRPCLLLPDGSPLKSESWLPLAEVLERFKSPAIPEKWQKLLVLDCNRLDSDWSLGQLENSFAEHLTAAVQAAGVHNLTVLNSCSPGETGWAGESLQGSSFGHYLRRGMAGEADSKEFGGNGNGRVSLHELHRYLTSEVGRWARTQRAAPQQPMLIPSDAEDYSVVWTLSKKWQTQLQKPMAEFVPPVTSEQIAALWRDHDRLLAHNPHRFDPCQWTELQQQLLRLEQLVRSGAEYASAAAGTHADLRRRLKAMTERAAQVEPGTGIASWRVFSPREAELPTRLPLHSRRLESFMGTNQAVAKSPAGPTLTDPAAPDSPAPAAGATAPSAERLTGVLLEDHAARVLRRFWPAGGDMELLQTAISNVALAERAAIPSDERAQYALHSLVDPADVQRRRAVDASMLDDERSVGIARAGWAKSREQFNEVQQAADDLRDAFATRDRAWSLAPFLAAWLARPLPEGEPAGPLDQKINAVLLPLLQANESLAEVLESTTQNKDVPISSVTQARADVEAKLSQLEAYFAEQCVLLSKAGRTPRTLRNLQAVLATPLVPAAQRADLNRRRDELEQYLSKQEREKDDSPPPAATSLAERSSVNWQEHPLLLLTGAEIKKDDDSSTDKDDGPRRRAAHASPHRTGEEVRLALLRIAADANQAATAAADASPAATRGELDAIRAARLALGRLVNRVRRTAPYCATAVRNDPVHRLRRFDLQQLMLWQVQRSLDDFWGPASDRDEAFFAKAAGDSLRLAADLAEPDAAVQSQITKLEKRLQTLRLAARKGLLPTASDVLLVNEAEDAKIETGVQPGPEELVKSLPPGEGTLLLRDAQGRLAGAGRGFSLPDAFTGDRAARKFEIPLASDVLAQRGPVLDAVALFRGNVYQTPFLLRAADGPRVEFTPYRYGPPKLTVAGRSKKKASILFVLDCSASMSAAITVEAPGDSRRATRMDAAKASLMKMLDQLAATENTRVGVRLFGHRAGWNVKVADQILRQTGYARPIPDDLTPGDDVETLLPLGRFDSSAAGEVRDVLKTVKPWGETPLYLSLIESIKDFASDEPDTEKSIVVITDGANYQFNARSPKGRDDVIAAGRKIPIHIVGFDIPESDAQQAKRDYTYIAEQTKGSFVSVSASTSLVQQLEGLLGNSMFTVSDSSGREIAQARVGTSIELPPGDGRASTVTVGLGSASKTITAEPGDGIELTLSADGKRIEPQFSQGKDATYLPMVRKTGGGPLKLLGGLQRPYWRDGGLVFSIYFRPEDKELLRRPAETWIQVRPGGKSGATGDEYNFYDANFEPDAPLPVLRWNAPRWPVKATTAEVQVWCKMTPTRPTWTVRLDEALADDLRSIEKELDGLRGLTYQVYARAGTGDSDPYRIAVVERHSADAPLDAIKVELSARPLKVRRTFDAEHRIVAHVFEVSPSDAQPLSNLSLRITRKEDLLDGAWQWKEPMSVAIPEPGDVIRLAPASGKSL